MDLVTTLALSIHNPLLTSVGQLIDNDFFYMSIILLLILIGERKNDKRIKILGSVLFALVLGFAIKQLVAEPRPCAGLYWCPNDYSFPSLHALIAFTLMAGFIRKKSFPFYLLFALFVSFTRLNLGVHIFVDIAGALPIALIAYYVTDRVTEKITNMGWKLGS